MSIRMLNLTMQSHGTCDDVESCFWVLLYCALHFMKLLNTNLVSTLLEIFDERSDLIRETTITSTGGWRKAGMLVSNKFFKLPFQSTPLALVITQFAEKLQDLYIARWTLSRYEDGDIKKTKYLEELRILEESVEDVQDIIDIFEAALKRDGWPELDAVPDQLPRRIKM